MSRADSERPLPPVSANGTPGDTTAIMTWTAPASLNGGSLTGYTVTARPGCAACTTTGATGCTITGLTNGEVRHHRGHPHDHR